MGIQPPERPESRRPRPSARRRIRTSLWTFERPINRERRRALQLSAREAARIARKERRETRRQTRIFMRLLIPLLVVALVHLTLAICVRGLIVVGISCFLALWLLPQLEQALRRRWRGRSGKYPPA